MNTLERICLMAFLAGMFGLTWNLSGGDPFKVVVNIIVVAVSAFFFCLGRVIQDDLKEMN